MILLFVLAFSNSHISLDCFLFLSVVGKAFIFLFALFLAGFLFENIVLQAANLITFITGWILER